MLEALRLEIEEAKKELEVARFNESVADPEYLDVAIEATNIAFLKLNNLYKRAKTIDRLSCQL